MLQIYIFGDREEGYLDIDPATTLQMEALSDIFDEDLSTGEYSLPVEFPWTDKNKRLTGFAERLKNSSSRKNWWRCHVFDDQRPQMLNGKLTLLEKAGLFSFKRGKFNATISSTKGLFGTQVATKKLTDLALGGAISWTTGDSRKFAYDVMTGVYPAYDYFVFAPVAIEGFIDQQRKDFTSEFLAKDTVNCVVANGSTWTFGRPVTATTVASPSQSEYMDYRTVPFFKLKWVFKKLFEEFGYSVAGAFMDEPGFDDLVVFNNYAIENYAPSTFVDFNKSINPAHHVPDMLVSEFIKAVCGFFCCYPVFGVNQVTLVYRKNNFTQKNILSLNGLVSGSFQSTLPAVEQGGIKSGYKLAYTWDQSDSYYSDRVKDITTKTLCATVAKVSDLGTLNIGRTLTTDDIAYVEADNLYYVVADSTGTPIIWEPWGEKLEDYVEGAGDNSTDFNISPLCTYVINNTTTGLQEKKNYVGTKQPGSYINNKGVRVEAPFGLRIFFVQMQAIGAATIPVSFTHNRNSANTRILPYSLAWNGADGMAQNFHLHWQNFKDAAERVKTNVMANEKVLTDLTTHNVYEIDSVQFLPYGVNKTIPMKTNFEIEIVPL